MVRRDDFTDPAGEVTGRKAGSAFDPASDSQQRLGQPVGRVDVQIGPWLGAPMRRLPGRFDA